MSRIAIIGTGRMARALGAGWQRAGHLVLFGSRAPGQRRDIQQELGPEVRIHGAQGAISGGEIVVLALPFKSVEAFAREHAGLLRDRPVVDISNPFDNLPDNRTAGAEITARAIGQGGRVIAAFKDNFYETLLDARDSSGLQRDVHYAGDDEEGKAMLARLVEDLGLRPVDCGPLRNARVLDGMVPLMIELDGILAGGGRRSSWKFLG